MVVSGALAIAYALQAAAMQSFYDGAQGDNRYQLAIVHRVQLGDYLGDYYYRGVPSHYPPLYFWLVGTIGRLGGAAPETTLRWSPIVSIFLACAAIAWAARRIGARPAAAILVTLVVGSFGAYYLFSYPPDRALWGILIAKPQQLLGALLVYAFSISFVSLRNRPVLRLVVGGVLVAATVLTMPIFLPIAVGGAYVSDLLAKTMAKGGRLVREALRSGGSLAVACVVGLALASPYLFPVLEGMLAGKSAGGYVYWQSLASLDPTHWTLGFGFGAPFVFGLAEAVRLWRKLRNGSTSPPSAPQPLESNVHVTIRPRSRPHVARTPARSTPSAARGDIEVSAEQAGLAVAVTAAVAWGAWASAYLTYPLFGWSYFSWWTVVVAAVGTCLLAARWLDRWIDERLSGAGSHDGPHTSSNVPRATSSKRYLAPVLVAAALAAFAVSWNARTDDLLNYAAGPIDSEFRNAALVLSRHLGPQESFVGGQEELVLAAVTGRGLVYVAHAFYANPLADNEARRRRVVELLDDPSCAKITALERDYGMRALVLSPATRWIPRIQSSSSIRVEGGVPGDASALSPGDLVLADLRAVKRGDPQRVAETVLYTASPKLSELDCLETAYSSDALTVLLVRPR